MLTPLHMGRVAMTKSCFTSCKLP